MFTIKQFTFSPIEENTYLLYNENNNAILIDPGCYSIAEKNTLKRFLEEYELNLKMLLNTHCHLDHVFGNKWVNETYGLKPIIHKDEEPMLRYAAMAGEKWSLPFDNYEGEVEYISEGDVISLDDDELEVIAAPGHSPGHVCFYSKSQNFLVGGDVLFYESIGRTDFPMCSHEDLIRNIKEKIFVLPEETTVYSGHGRPTTVGHEKKFNPFID